MMHEQEAKQEKRSILEFMPSFLPLYSPQSLFEFGYFLFARVSFPSLGKEESYNNLEHGFSLSFLPLQFWQKK